MISESKAASNAPSRQDLRAEGDKPRRSGNDGGAVKGA
jgi:hypothetical protein